MRRTARMAAYMVALTLMLSGLALAQDDDGYYRRGGAAQAQQYGYNNGFRDGEKRGRHEGRENDPNDYRTPDWRQASHGYKDWMGPLELYQRGYQDGYQQGFRSGFESEAGTYGRRDRDSDLYYRGGGYGGGGYGWNGGYEEGRQAADRWGYQDGADQARGDLEHGKRYNPKPRGRYDDCDRGYRGEFGSKDSYKAEYREAFYRGYDEAMGGRRY